MSGSVRRRGGGGRGAVTSAAALMGVTPRGQGFSSASNDYGDLRVTGHPGRKNPASSAVTTPDEPDMDSYQTLIRPRLVPEEQVTKEKEKSRSTLWCAGVARIFCGALFLGSGIFLLVWNSVNTDKFYRADTNFTCPTSDYPFLLDSVVYVDPRVGNRYLSPLANANGTINKDDPAITPPEQVFLIAANSGDSTDGSDYAIWPSPVLQPVYYDWTDAVGLDEYAQLINYVSIGLLLSIAFIVMGVLDCGLGCSFFALTMQTGRLNRCVICCCGLPARALSPTSREETSRKRLKWYRIPEESGSFPLRPALLLITQPWVAAVVFITAGISNFWMLLLLSFLVVTWYLVLIGVETNNTREEMIKRADREYRNHIADIDASKKTPTDKIDAKKKIFAKYAKAPYQISSAGYCLALPTVVLSIVLICWYISWFNNGVQYDDAAPYPEKLPGPFIVYTVPFVFLAAIVLVDMFGVGLMRYIYGPNHVLRNDTAIYLLRSFLICAIATLYWFQFGFTTGKCETWAYDSDNNVVPLPQTCNPTTCAIIGQPAPTPMPTPPPPPPP